MTKSDELLTQEVLTQAALQQIPGFRKIQTQRANELVIRNTALDLYVTYMAAHNYRIQFHY